MTYFEDIVIGETIEFGRHLFTSEEIKRFASAFDPQPFHTDEAAAERSHFGRLCASGWHTTAVWMRLMMQERTRRAEAHPAGEHFPILGPSPGFDDLKWLKPVYAGDSIALRSTAVAKRESRSRPEWGIVSFRNEGGNQAGEAVISFITHSFVERRIPG